jgi:hypothetical protein
MARHKLVISLKTLVTGDGSTARSSQSDSTSPTTVAARESLD